MSTRGYHHNSPKTGGIMSIAHCKAKAKYSAFHALHQSCIGVDVHANLIVGVYQRAQFGKTTIEEQYWNSDAIKSSLKKFALWCKSLAPEIIIMESTGVYWQSLYEQLELVGFTSEQLVVVNARDVKNRRGSKTDRSDAVHLAEVARQGNYRSSFVPRKDIRELRCISRAYSQLKNQRKSLVNVLHKQLCQVGCRASSVFSDIRGKMATKILDALIDGYEGDELLKKVKEICKNSRGRLKASPKEIVEALDADMESKVWFSIRKIIEHIRYLDKELEEHLDKLREETKPYKSTLDLLMTIPSVKEITAIGIVCELGDDLSAFESVRKFSRWIGLAPGNNESAGKRYSGKITPGNKYLKTLLVEAASGIGLSKTGYLKEVHQRLKERRGTKRANVAIAHKLCRIIYSVLKNKTAYVELYKPVLKDHRLEKAVHAVAGLRTVGYACDDITVEDIETGMTSVIFGANKSKLTSNSQLVT